MPPRKRQGRGADATAPCNDAGKGRTADVVAEPVSDTSQSAVTCRATEEVADEVAPQSQAQVPNFHGSGGLLTCIVTPKLTFNVPRKPEWKEVGDIAQEDIRTAFAQRFPPSIGLDFSKLSFKPAIPPGSELTEDMRALVFKVSSEDVAEDRVMLSIIHDLERCYASKIQKSAEETKSEIMSESLSFQSLVDEVKRHQDKQVSALEKQNGTLRDQLQSVQKRLFLMEQEKDQLQKEQLNLKEKVNLAGRHHEETVHSLKSENEDLRAELAIMQGQINEVLECKKVWQDSPRAAVQVAPHAAAVLDPTRAVLEDQVEQLQQQLGSLQEWLRQGSQLLQPSLQPSLRFGS